MKAARLWLYRWLSALIPETSCFGLKAAALRWCGAKVGRNVRIGSSARFLGTGALEIGDDVWIGARATILPWVSLAEKTVTAAGAVVTKSCGKPKVLLAGVPAAVRKEFMDKGLNVAR